MGATALAFNVWLESIECCNCGVVFAMPVSWLKHYREDPDRWFYCPAGHQQHFAESEVTRLKKQLSQYQSQLEWEKGRRKNTERRLSAQKGQVTKIKRRVGKGVCPCCNRFFPNLHNHMETQHPDFAQAEQ